MAALNYDWQEITHYDWTWGYLSVRFYIEARLTSQDIANNRSYVQTRLSSRVTAGSGAGSGWYYSLTYANTIQGSDVWTFATEPILEGSSGAIGHNEDGTKSITISSVVKNNYAGLNHTLSVSVDLPTIPRRATISSAPNFNDEQNPTIKYINSAGSSVTTLQVGIGSTADASVMYVGYRDVSKTGDSYTFNLTNAERTALRNATTTSNTKTIAFWIKTVIGGVTYHNGLAKTLSIVNANPTFTAAQVTYKDTNASVVAITGNDQNIVRNNSTLQYKYTAATGNKGATISRYEISFNGTTTTKSTAATINYGVLNASSNLDLVIKAIDTRGNSTTATKSINVLDWVLPSAQISLARVNNYEDTTKLKVNVSISYVDGKNTIQSIKYRYKKTEDASYSGYTSINNNQEYSITFDKTYSWDIQIQIVDKFGTTTYNLVLAKGMPIMFIDIEKLSVGIDKFPVGNTSMETNKLYIGDTLVLYDDGQ